jgi:hypothetical protein
MSNSAELCSEAWLLRGISSIPGELRLANGRLSFTASGCGSMWKWQLNKLERDARQPGLAGRMDAGECAVIFDVPAAGLQVEFPWYYLSGGLKIRAGGFEYRLSFGRPSNTRMPVDKSDPIKAATRALEELSEVGTMRRVGEAWKKALSSGRAA